MTLPVAGTLTRTFSGNGSTTAFNYPERFIEAADLVVILRDADGVDTVQTITTHYTLSVAPYTSGATVTFVTAPASGETVVLTRSTLKRQDVDLDTFSRNDAGSVEDQLDRLAMVDQDMGLLLNRTLKADHGQAGLSINTSVVTEGKTLMRGAGNTLVAGPDAADIAGAQDNAALATAAKEGAETAQAAAEAAQAVAEAAADSIDYKVLDTVAAMVASTTLSIGDNVRTAGYYAAGDGGGNDYKIVAAATGTVDGGRYIDLSGITGQAKGGFPNAVASVLQFGAKRDGTTDDTAKFQAAIDAFLKVYVPEGVYAVDASTGIVVRQGSHIYGDGIEATVLYPSAEAGSIIKRVAPATDSTYRRSVTIEDISIVFNHPATADPGNYEQIGFDMRAMSRSVARRCYAGNYNRGGLRATRTDPAAQSDAVQGYGFVLGTTPTNYCGGEANTVELCQVYGAKKAIVADDLTLSPLSAAYGTSILNNDIQICETGIAFENQYNAGSEIRGNTIQSVRNARGSSATTYAYRIACRAITMVGKYVEVTEAACDYILKLDSTALNNDITMGLFGNDDAFIAMIVDSAGWGGHNRIRYFVPSTERLVQLDGGRDAEAGRDRARVLHDATPTILGQSLSVASVAKNGTGDFTITFSTNTFLDADYNYSIAYQFDTSGSGGSATVRTQSSTILRVVYRNAAGAAADPIRMSVRCG